MKLSRLTNSQLRNLLRRGEVRFALNPKSPLRQKWMAEGMGGSKAEFRDGLRRLAGKKFLIRFRDFCKDVMGDLKRGKYEFEDFTEAMRFIKKFDEIAKKIWVKRRGEFEIGGYFPGHKPTPANISAAISRIVNYWNGPLKDHADGTLWTDEPANPNFYSLVKSFQIPDSWSYFSEFRK